MSHIDALLRCVDEQSALLDDFIKTLQAEGQLLLETPSDEALGTLTARKNDYARRLGELDQTRSQHLAELGFTDTRESIESACVTHPDLHQAFKSLWQRAGEAQALNESNGQILHTFIEHNQRALDTLRTLMGEDLYDARGKLPRHRPL
ncbi:MAG TPA: flagellar protein FlgN [Castellaniella sp.]|uniref:flagella synthesis protein FlgN n=1 Tax=Castellaniella sp. TaxID=1955812 RepID=UPI002EF93E74